MKKLLIGAALGLAACSSPEPAAPDDGALAMGQLEAPIAPTAPAAPAEALPAPAAIEAAKTAIAAEPKVKDLMYRGEDAVQWHVGVLDDGSSRVGYALYICNLLREHQAMSGRTHVRIVDVAKVAQGQDLRTASLGHVICETGDVVAP